MELNFKTFGAGEPIIILHGLFGTLDNWQTLAKELANHFSVFIVDHRNHGRSPHTFGMYNYMLLADDLKTFMEQQWIYKARLIGHSMGGKTVMQMALNHPDMVEKLCVVDIAPKQYGGGHETILDAMRSLDLTLLKDRHEAQVHLSKTIKEQGVVQFLLKNLTRNHDGTYSWKMNFKNLDENYQNILNDIEDTGIYDGQTLFVKGENSDYIEVDSENRIRSLFPKAQIQTIKNAGHWVHADQPQQLLESVLRFMTE